jgi:hypothetical protein
MTRSPISVLAMLLMGAATCAAAKTENSAIRGCLWASPVGAYQLTADDTGAVYNLVGSSEELGLLVGSDVLVTGSRLAENEAAVDSQRDVERTGSNEMFERASPAENSFRVIRAIKFNDLCVLSSTSKARVPDSGPAKSESRP